MRIGSIAGFDPESFVLRQCQAAILLACCVAPAGAGSLQANGQQDRSRPKSGILAKVLDQVAQGMAVGNSIGFSRPALRRPLESSLQLGEFAYARRVFLDPVGE